MQHLRMLVPACASGPKLMMLATREAHREPGQLPAQTEACQRHVMRRCCDLQLCEVSQLKLTQAPNLHLPSSTVNSHRSDESENAICVADGDSKG